MGAQSHESFCLRFVYGNTTMTSRSSFLRAAAGGLGAAALAGCGGSVVPPTSAFPAILPNARRAVRRAFDPASVMSRK